MAHVPRGAQPESGVGLSLSDPRLMLTVSLSCSFLWVVNGLKGILRPGTRGGEAEDLAQGHTAGYY